MENQPKQDVSTDLILGFLRFVGWVYLIASVIGAFWIWISYGTRPCCDSIILTEVDPLAVAIGVAVLFQGAVICVVLLAIALITKTLLIMRSDA